MSGSPSTAWSPACTVAGLGRLVFLVVCLLGRLAVVRFCFCFILVVGESVCKAFYVQSIVEYIERVLEL